jgi:hypothetical protein
MVLAAPLSTIARAPTSSYRSLSYVYQISKWGTNISMEKYMDGYTLFSSKQP